jgi:hypothetical protein
MKKLIFSLISVMLAINVSFSQEQKFADREFGEGKIITGSCLFATPWLVCVLKATGGDKGTGYLAIPIVGPFITNSIQTPSSSEGLIVAYCISIAEAAGIGLVTWGIIGKKRPPPTTMIFPVFNKNGIGLKMKMDL